MNVGRRSSGRDAEGDIERADAAGVDVDHCVFDGVLCAFDGMRQRGVAACDDALHELRVGVKGRRALSGVEYAEPPAGTRAEVEEASASGELLADQLDGRGDRRACVRERAAQLRVFLLDERDRREGVELVQVARARVAALGGKVSAVRHQLSFDLRAMRSPASHMRPEPSVRPPSMTRHSPVT